MVSVVIVAPNSFDRFFDNSGAEIQFQLLTKTLHPGALYNLALLANYGSRRPVLKHGMKKINPMAGYYLESFLKLRGWDVRTVFDWSNDDSLTDAMEADPVAVLFSTTYITNNQMLENCIRALRAVIGDTPLMIGGPYIWKQKIELLKQSQPAGCGSENSAPIKLRNHRRAESPQLVREALKKFGVDGLKDNLFAPAASSTLRDAIYVASEFGEYTAIRVLDRLVSKSRQLRALTDIPNVVVSTSDGAWQATATEPEPFDLNKDFTHWDLIDTLPDYVPMRTSVGCPYRCRYCDFIELHPTVIMRSPESILEEVRAIRARGKRLVNFIDDNIFLSKKRIAHLTRTLLEHDARIYWGGFFRVDRIDEENIEELWESGCRFGLCGIESGDSEMLELMRKECRSDEASRGIDLATAAGMQLKLTFIVGYPGETKESIDNTAEFINGLAHTNHGYSSFQIYPLYILPSTALDEPDFRAEHEIHGRFNQWTHSTMTSEDATKVWSPYLFRNVDALPYEYHVSDFPKGWRVERRSKAFQLRKELTIAFLDGLDDDGIQERFVPLFHHLRDTPADRVPHWDELLANRRYQPGGQRPSLW